MVSYPQHIPYDPTVYADETAQPPDGASAITIVTAIVFYLLPKDYLPFKLILQMLLKAPASVIPLKLMKITM